MLGGNDTGAVYHLGGESEDERLNLVGDGRLRVSDVCKYSGQLCLPERREAMVEEKGHAFTIF